MDEGVGCRVQLSPDAGDAARAKRQNAGKAGVAADIAAFGDGAGGVQHLHQDRDVIDLLPVAQHQNAEIVAGEVLELIMAHIAAEAGHRHALRPGEAHAAGADQGKTAQPLIQILRRVATEDGAEGEADQIEAVFGSGEELLQAVGDHPADLVRILYVRRRVAVAQARRIGGVDGEMLAEERDIANPVDPRAIAAVEKYQVRLAAAQLPHPPDLMAFAGGSLEDFRVGLHRADGGCGLRHRRNSVVHARLAQHSHRHWMIRPRPQTLSGLRPHLRPMP